jgi:hypothetical protein
MVSKSICSFAYPTFRTQSCVQKYLTIMDLLLPSAPAWPEHWNVSGPWALALSTSSRSNQCVLCSHHLYSCIIKVPNGPNHTPCLTKSKLYSVPKTPIHDLIISRTVISKFASRIRTGRLLSTFSTLFFLWPPGSSAVGLMVPVTSAGLPLARKKYSPVALCPGHPQHCCQVKFFKLA